MNSRKRPVLLSLAVLTAFVALQPASAQSAREVLQTALERYEERMEGIQDYTVVQEVMNQATTVHFERTTVDGHTVFQPDVESPAAAGVGHLFMERWMEKAVLRGTETVDGEPCHVVAFEGLTREDFEGAMPPALKEQEAEWSPEEMTLYLDVEGSLIRRMIMEGTAEVEGERRDVTFDAEMRDYREVDGLLHPFLTEIEIRGLSPEIDPEQRAQMEKALEQMENMPPAMRERMEGMRQMLESEEMSTTVEVREVRVNQGPPSASR